MPNALSIRHLEKIYPNKTVALSGIDLEVSEGDFFGLLGPNGAGKSTTIGIISSLVNKTRGEVKVFGTSLDHDLAQVKRHIGLVPQEFNFNIFEKVEDILINQAGYYGVPRHIAIRRAEHYLKILGLWEKRQQPSMRLSGGMKRRLMIARALVHEPRLLILDEPTAGVDIELRRSMWDFLREINRQGTTIILTTHYLEEAENLCKNIAIIDQGKIIENNSTAELLKKLNTEIFVLYLKNHLLKAPSIQTGSVQLLDETTLEIEISQTQSLTQVFQQLAEQNIDVLSMRNKTNRLEELFIKLVGKHFEDAKAE